MLLLYTCIFRYLVRREKLARNRQERTREHNGLRISCTPRFRTEDEFMHPLFPSHTSVCLYMLHHRIIE